MYTLTAVWARGARGSCPVIHPVRHQGGKSEYVSVRTTASKDAAKGTRGPSVQMQWMCTCNNHVRKRGCIRLKMRQRSYNNQVLRRGYGVHAVPSSDAAVCATFKDVAGHNGVQGQATCTESAKGVIHSDAAGARVGDNHVWVRQRSERWPSSPSSRYQGGKSEYVTKHTTVSEDTAKGVRGPFRRGRWRRWLNLVFSCRGGHPQAGETSFCYIGNDSRLPRISRNG